jgi:hypothetical protein
VSAADARTLRLALPVTGDDDVRALRSALLAARATERSELERRAGRHSLGYGNEGARSSMDDDVVRFRRRIELLDLLIAALDDAAKPEDPTA